MFRKSNELNILYGGRRLHPAQIFNEEPDSPTAGENLPTSAVFTDVAVKTSEVTDILIYLYNEDADLWIKVASEDGVGPNGARLIIPTRGWDRICLSLTTLVESLEAFIFYPRMEN